MAKSFTWLLLVSAPFPKGGGVFCWRLKVGPCHGSALGVSICRGASALCRIWGSHAMGAAALVCLGGQLHGRSAVLTAIQQSVVLPAGTGGSWKSYSPEECGRARCHWGTQCSSLWRLHYPWLSPAGGEGDCRQHRLELQSRDWLYAKLPAASAPAATGRCGWVGDAHVSATVPSLQGCEESSGEMQFPPGTMESPCVIPSSVPTQWISLSPTQGEHPMDGVASVLAALSDRAYVKKDWLEDVVRKDRYRVNNKHDETHPPLPVSKIVRWAQELVGREMPYNLTSHNCEHFVMELRYGVAMSDQVTEAIAMGTVGVMGVAAAVIRSMAQRRKHRKE
ncbi:uncharacterized protein LOC102934292 isoform X1 [Chelonia mydas]|uniref:uncharacterized protein LOC102934292 isoform X1 n=1 Tax=Chelonia mydas TaxID=8469 RepID=UPI0018A1DF84|nr:uncharacterized protein LOC102934292 isoform X1 [Chelonia mydas]